MNNLNFADNVSQLRRARGITQETLADFVGVTKASVSKWETGQSLPDIATLLLLAAYYDVTLDELLGYRPELSGEQIRKLYHGLAEDFAKKPFEKVFARSQELVKSYYSCYRFLLQIALLWLNHYMLAAPERQVQVLEEIVNLCVRIYENSVDNGLCSDAIVLEALVKQQQGKYADVIATMEEVCNPYRFARNADSLLFQAYMQAGEVEKADARMQLYIFEAALAMLNGVGNYLLVHGRELEKCEQMIARTDAMLEQGSLEQIHPNAAAQFHYNAATIYCTHGKLAEGAARLRRFAQIIRRMKENGMRLCGDVLLDRLDEWFEGNELGAKAVRDSAVIMDSAQQALENPVFSCLSPQERKEILAEL